MRLFVFYLSYEAGYFLCVATSKTFGYDFSATSCLYIDIGKNLPFMNRYATYSTKPYPALFTPYDTRLTKDEHFLFIIDDNLVREHRIAIA